jgi:hypothetical protein
MVQLWAMEWIGLNETTLRYRLHRFMKVKKLKKHDAVRHFMWVEKYDVGILSRPIRDEMNLDIGHFFLPTFCP